MATMARPESAGATQQLLDASQHVGAEFPEDGTGLSPRGSAVAGAAPARAVRSAAAQRSRRPQRAEMAAVEPVARELSATISTTISAFANGGGGSLRRVPTPTLLRRTGERSDGERTSSPDGSPPAWVSMGERSQWREEMMEQARVEQERLMQSLWARNLPDDPPEPLAEGRRLKMMGRGLSGTLSGVQASSEGAADDAGAAAAATVTELGRSMSSKQLDAPGVTVAIAQPLVASGTPKQVVPRPVSAPNPAKLGGASLADFAHTTGTQAPHSEPFSPVDGSNVAGATTMERPQTADGRIGETQLLTGRSFAAPSSRAAIPSTREHSNASHHSASAAVASGDGRVSAAVAAALMQEQTAPPDPSGLDPMAGLQLLPTNTKPADIWSNGEFSTACLAADSDSETIGLVDRIGEGRVDKRAEFRRNKDIVDWQERAQRLAKTVRATTAEVEVTMRRLQHMGGAEAGLIGEAGQAGKARSEEVRSLRKGREAIAVAVSRVKADIKHPQRRGRSTGRNSGTIGGGLAGKTDELATLKNDISAAEAALVEHKNDQRRGYEILRQSEASLVRELKLFAETLDDWEKESIHNKENQQASAQTSSRRPHGKKSSSTNPRLTASAKPGSADVTQGRPSDAPAEVEVFESFLAEFGASGGWDAADHSTFLQVWSRYVKSAEAASGTQYDHWAHSTRFLASASAALPLTSEDVVSEHARWYLEYTRLLDAKRSAIAAWRERKRLTAERRRIKLEERAAREEAGAGPKLAKGNDPETRKANAKKLEEWRARRNAAKKKELEERQAAEDRARAKRQMEERREKARRQEIMRRRKERLAEKERQSEMLAAAEADGSVSSRPSTASTIEQLQARDREFVLRKKEARIAKQQSLENARRLSSGAQPPTRKIESSRVERDPERLYKPTMTTLLRYDLGEFDSDKGGERTRGAGEKPDQLGRRTNVVGRKPHQRRATPTWRSNPGTA